MEPNKKYENPDDDPDFAELLDRHLESLWEAAERDPEPQPHWTEMIEGGRQIETSSWDDLPDLF